MHHAGKRHSTSKHCAVLKGLSEEEEFESENRWVMSGQKANISMGPAAIVGVTVRPNSKKWMLRGWHIGVVAVKWL